MEFDFSKEIDKSDLSTMKWDAEIAKSNNKDLLVFGTADMDFMSPKPIRDALSSVVKSGHFGYPFIQDGYYYSIINWYKLKTKWNFKKEAIATNVGIYTSVWTAIDALTDPGDEIVYQPPVHHCFREIIENNGRVPVENPLIINNGVYTMDFKSLQNVLSERTRLFLLCNPHNPVGRAWSKEELERLADFCISNNFKIVSDDVYSGLTYESSKYTPIASLSSDTSDITVICNSASKPYNITGIKHSYVICENTEMMKMYMKSLKKLDLTYGENIMGLAATEAAYNFCNEWVKALMRYIKGNFTYLEEFIKTHMPKIDVFKPEATYFAWLDYRKLGLSPTALEDHFKHDVKIKIENGKDFGEGGSGFIRMNIACTKKTLKKGLKRMKTAYDLKFH